MQFGHFTNDQKAHFLALAYKVALADSWIRAPEESILQYLTRRVGIPSEEVSKATRGEPRLEMFTNRRTRILVLFELLCLAYSDNEFHVDESRLLLDISRQFQITEGDFAALKGLARRQAALDREIAKIAQARGR